jgi:hypothetical protein
MNRAQLVSLATVIHDIRPDWQHAGIIAQLRILLASWTGTHTAFYVHVVDIAADPHALTPGAFNAIAPRFAPAPTSTITPRRRGEIDWDAAARRASKRDHAHEPFCLICDRTEARHREVAEKTGDLHPFTT